MYDPNFYDDYCDAYYWCFREYDANTCEPLSANGWTEYEAMQVISAVYWGPMYLLWGAVGFWFLPWSTCYWMADYDYFYCEIMGANWENGWEFVITLGGTDIDVSPSAILRSIIETFLGIDIWDDV